MAWFIATPERCLALGSSALLAATLATEAAFFSGSVFATGTNRQDHFVYGRYLDIFQPLVITLGVAACLAAARRSNVRRLLVLGSVAVVAIVAIHRIVDLVGNDELTFAQPFNPFTALNLARYETRIDRAAVETLAAVVVSMTALALTARWVAGRASWRSTSVALTMCVLPLVALNLLRWHDAVEATDRVDYRDAQAVARRLDDAGVTDVLIDDSIWIGDQLYLEVWLPDVTSQRVSLPTEIECGGTSALVTGAGTTAPADMVAGRLAVVDCDGETDRLAVAPPAP
jgi:hypothetical protein